MEDLKLQLRGDISNFDALRALLLRLSKSNDNEKRALLTEHDGPPSSASRPSSHDDDWSEDPELDNDMASWCW